MSIINFRQLIDAAIGSPDPGHVNFNALYCLLYHFADKLKLLDTPVDNTKFGNVSLFIKKGAKAKWPLFRKKGSSRLLGGSDEPAPDVGENPVQTEEVQPESAPKAGVIDQPEPLPQEVPQEASPEPTQEPPQEPPQDAQPDVTPEVPQEVPEQDVTEDVPQQEALTENLPETVQVDTTVTTEGPPPAETESAADRKMSARGSKQFDIVFEKTPSFRKSEIQEKIERERSEQISEELMFGVQIMKDQIDLAMEQLNILANIMIRGKTDAFTQDLRKLNNKMRIMQRDNIYIESRKGIGEDSREMTSEHFSEEMFMEEYVTEEMELKKSLSKIEVEEPEVEGEAETQIAYVEPTLEYHLCYSPEKMMDQLLELKSEFCMLTNKVNDIMVALMEQDSQRTKVILAELQEQMREVRHTTTMLKDGLEFMEQKQKVNLDAVEEIREMIELIQKTKVDTTELEIRLAEKADYSLLERKVSHEQMREMLCRIEKQFCEMQRLINFNEKHALQVIENMRKNLGLDNVDQMLKDFRDKVDQDILKLQSILQKYLDLTNDECAAAGARVKVLKDLACLSCDTDCVMRTMEKSKVAKLPNARASPGIAPLITYELGAIRKSGIMGYYRKDEFPHSPNAWLERHNVALKMCAPRHAGGEHTTHTAKDHIQKVVMNKRPK